MIAVQGVLARASPVLLAGILGLLAAAGPFGFAPPAKAAVTAEQAKKPPARPDIVLTDLTPTVAAPHSIVTVSGTVANHSASTMTDVDVALRVSSQLIRTRYQLAQVAQGEQISGYRLSGASAEIDDLEPGDSRDFELSFDVDRLRLGPFGAYPLTVEVRARTDDGSVVSQLPTFLPWIPDPHEFKPTDIAWLWPLADGVHRAVGDTFLDDDLAGELSGQGRLGQLLDAATSSGVPLTYLVDPELLDDVTRMSAEGGYQVDAGKRTREGTGGPAASAWLAKLRAAAASTPVIALPYADPDLAALQHAGLDRDISTARQTGLTVAHDVLGVAPVNDTVAPPGGYLDQPTLEAVADSLASTVVLRDTAVPPDDPRDIPGVRTDLPTASGSIGAVLTDSTIDDLIADPAKTPGGPRAAEQRFLAETLLITEQRPGRGSTVVIAPPHRWAPPDGFAQALLADTAAVPWLRPVLLSEVRAQPDDGVKRRQLTYPASAADAELPGRQLRDVPVLRQKLAAYAAVLATGQPGTFMTEANAALLRTESSALRGKRALAARVNEAVASDIDAQLGKLHLAPMGLITLTSHRQQVPVSIVNELGDPVTVQVRLTPSNPARLKVADPTPVTVAAHQRATVDVTVEATGSGRTHVSAQLETTGDPGESGQPYGPSTTIELNSTAYGSVALAIAAGATGLLVVAAGLRITRRVVRARRRA